MSRNDRIKELRLSLKLSQEQLGDAIGITKSGISSIENGTRNLSDKHIKLICASYSNVSAEWLQSGDGNMFMETDDTILSNLSKKYNLDSFEKRILQAFLELPQERRKQAKEILMAISSAATEAEFSQEPIYGTEEWADRQAELYKQELIIESHEKTSAALHDIKEA